MISVSSFFYIREESLTAIFEFSYYKEVCVLLYSDSSLHLYVIVAGSRSFNNYSMLKEKLDYYLSVKISQGFKIHIVSGGAKGADILAEQYAKEKGYESLVFPADWNRFDKSAGYKRNRQMHEFIAQFPYRACVCFWDGISHGTADNFNLCNEYKTPLRKVIFTTER